MYYKQEERSEKINGSERNYGNSSEIEYLKGESNEMMIGNDETTF